MDALNVSNPVLNIGREVCISVTPMFNDEPMGWGNVELALEPDGLNMLEQAPQREGLNFYAMPKAKAFGVVKGSVVFKDADKVVLRVPFDFTLIVPPGKAKPNNAVINVTVAPATVTTESATG